MGRKYDTRQREHLISFLEQHTDQQLSVREIAQSLCSQQVSLSAIYRNLSYLESEGLLRKSIKPGSREACYQYVGTSVCQSHLHMSCTRCGRALHVGTELTQQIARAMSESDGFELDISNSILYGVCQDCRHS